MSQVFSILCLSIKGRCVETCEVSSASNWRKQLLITTYQEVNDQLWSNTCCDDENERIGGNTDLPEQHFPFKWKTKKNAHDALSHHQCVVCA